MIAMSRTQLLVLALLAKAGLVALAVGLVLDPVRAWSALLTSGFFYLSISLGALAFLALGAVGGAGWSSVFKRVPEAMGNYLPFGAVTMLLLLFGLPSLYHWAGHGAHDLGDKHLWLNTPFFAVRMAIVLVLWIGFAAALRRRSLAQDLDPDVRHTRRTAALSAVFLLVLGLSFSVASFDWLMSLDPHWSSTIFALYNLAGLLVAGVSAITIVVVLLRRRGLLPQVNEHHLHDLGKLAFGFSTFWAYLWLSQYLLIWYANIPEETTHFLTRTQGGWSFLFYGNLVVNWLIPFLALLPKRAKKSEPNLLWICGILLGGRWLDLYLAVAPATMPEHRGIGLIDLAVALGLGAVFVLVVARTLAGAPLLPKGDPYLIEGLHHHAS